MCEANPSYPLGFSYFLSINAQLTLYGESKKKRDFFWNYKNSFYICSQLEVTTIINILNSYDYAKIYYLS